ncbi:dickkopf-related protein 4 [Lissotriton helveticus]
MVCVLLLGLASLYCPLSALVLDYNTIRGSAEVQGNRKVFPCQADRDCRDGQVCLRSDGKAPSCVTCHHLRRRCQNSAMCCPGIQCVNGICAKPDDTAAVQEKQLEGYGSPISNTKVIPELPTREKRRKKKPDSSAPAATKVQEGESCLRTQDCDTGLCCARHFWTKICKVVLHEGQVCSGRKHKDPAQRPEIFQRCDCGPGLTCRSQSRAGKPRSRLRVCQRQ